MVFRALIRRPFAACLCVAAACFSLPASAQSPGVATANAEPSEPVCMARSLPNVAQVPAAKRGQSHRILTVEKSAAALEAKGFARVDCGTADLRGASQRGQWRDEMCALAASGNEAVQNQLERALGERPAVLCALAEQASGPWQRARQATPKIAPPNPKKSD